MDRFAQLTKKSVELHNEIVEAIKELLLEMGYNPGTSGIRTPKYRIAWEFDRILVIGGKLRYETHTDHLNIDELLDVLHEIYHVF